MNVDFSNGAIGTIQASRTAAGQLDQLRLRVYGEKGSIEMIYDTGRSYLRACMDRDLDTANWRDIPYDPVETNYQRFVAAVRAGKTQEPSFRRAANHPEGARRGAGFGSGAQGRRHILKKGDSGRQASLPAHTDGAADALTPAQHRPTFEWVRRSG